MHPNVCTITTYNSQDLWKWKLLSRIWLFVTPWTAAHQAPLSIEFSRQEYWSGLPFLFPGESSKPRDQTQVSRSAGGFFTTEPLGKTIKTDKDWKMLISFNYKEGFGLSGASQAACQCKRHRRRRFNLWVGRIPWKRKWQPTPVFLPGKFHGERSLAGYSPWGHKESHPTERLTMIE